MKAEKGFTLVEIMIVVAIIGLIALIAIPSFLRARENSRMKGCINNLRLIDGAKEQYALERGRMDGEFINATDPSDYASFSELVGGVKGYIREFPLCPSGDPSRERSAQFSAKDYGVEVIGENPFCRLRSDDEDYPHSLPLNLGGGS